MSIDVTRALDGAERPPAFWANIGLKSALALLLLVPVLNPGWQQYDDKAMPWRIVVFPLAALVVPVAWQLTGAKRPYPYLADGLFVSVPLTDVLWNSVDAYDRIGWWDDLIHLLNSVVIAYVIGLWLRRYTVGPAISFFLVLGLGMTLAVGWELAEYPTFLNGSDELSKAYGDTLGDLGLALIGSTVAAALVGHRLRTEPPSEPNEPGPALALARR